MFILVVKVADYRQACFNYKNKCNTLYHLIEHAVLAKSAFFAASPKHFQPQYLLLGKGSCFFSQSLIASSNAAACVTSRRAHATSNAILRSLDTLPRTSLISSLIAPDAFVQANCYMLIRQKLICVIFHLRFCAFESMMPGILLGHQFRTKV